MITHFDGCKGCDVLLTALRNRGKGEPLGMRDWWLHQLHLYVKHDALEHWRKNYSASSLLRNFPEDTVRSIMAGRERCVREELRKLGVEL